MQDEGNEKFMAMRGMTAKNFDPVRYSGRWFEVASLKRGFAGQGQEDCHCTQVSKSYDIVHLCNGLKMFKYFIIPGNLYL